MKRISLIFLAAALAVLPACKPAPQQQPAPSAENKDYPGKGVVTAFQAEGKIIVLKHEAIVGLMEGMTMGFELKDPALAKGFKVGDNVDFVLSKRGDDYKITSLKKR